MNRLARLFLFDVVRDRQSRPIFSYAFVFIVFGTAIYHWFEGWSWLDSLYFCVVTMSTVGYGDLHPTTPITKLFTIFFIINGVVILLALFDRIRVVRTRHMLGSAADERTAGSDASG